MHFYLTSALSEPLISLYSLMSASSKVLFGLCTRFSVEEPFTPRKLVQVVILTLPPLFRMFMKTQGCSVLCAASCWFEIEGLGVLSSRSQVARGPSLTFEGSRSLNLRKKPPTCEATKSDRWAEGYGNGSVAVAILPVTFGYGASGGSDPQQ